MNICKEKAGGLLECIFIQYIFNQESTLRIYKKILRDLSRIYFLIFSKWSCNFTLIKSASERKNKTNKKRFIKKAFPVAKL